MTVSDFYQSPEFRKFQRKYTSKLMKHQKNALDFMDDNDKGSICAPTGTGKSMIIYSDLLDKIQFNTFDTFCIVSHRLLLNTQHFNSIFDVFKNLLPHIGIIFIGSYQMDLSKYIEDVEVNKRLADNGISLPELLFSSSNRQDINDKIKFHHDNERDVIVISTYHSLDKLKDEQLHTIYCDEAHFLATPQETAMFKENFEKINAKRNFFFTATPRDLDEKENPESAFLMNNKEIFGERHELSFREALEQNLIVKPYLHILELANYTDEKNFFSPKNYAKVVIDAFNEHTKTLKHLDKCGPKLLVKCPSVYEMWKIKRELVKTSDADVKIFAGASRGDEDSIFSFEIDEDKVGSKIDFLANMQGLGNEEKVIILHYDILSEGIDVPGITAVMFLSKSLPGISKICQTIGRATRLHPEDRDNVFISQTVLRCDYNKMIKPYCAVILPVMSREMGYSAEQIARLLIDLREKFKIKCEMAILGSDNPTGTKENLQEGFNKLDEKLANESKINKIKHFIELFDNEKTRMIAEEDGLKMHALKETNVVEYIKEFSNFLKNN